MIDWNLKWVDHEENTTQVLWIFNSTKAIRRRNIKDQKRKFTYPLLPHYLKSEEVHLPLTDTASHIGRQGKHCVLNTYIVLWNSMQLFEGVALTKTGLHYGLPDGPNTVQRLSKQTCTSTCRCWKSAPCHLFL